MTIILLLFLKYLQNPPYHPHLHILGQRVYSMLPLWGHETNNLMAFMEKEDIL